MVVPTLTSVTIKSSNANPVRAGVTDDVILSFTADQLITIFAITIDGKPADSITNVSGNDWTAFRKAEIDDTPGSVAFTIDFLNNIAEVGVQVTSTTDGSFVIFNESTNTLPKFADTDRVYRDIGKVRGSNENRDNLIVRADEDASSQLQGIFLNLVDFEDLDSVPWFTDLATKLTTALFWKKSNGSTEQQQIVKDTLNDAESIKLHRFAPVEYI